MMTIRDYVMAESLEQAFALNQKKGSRILGGMLWLRLSSTPITTAIDLGALGLDTIEETEDAFSIGAMARLRQLEQHPGLNAYTQGAVKDALGSIVGVQFRNLATVGGSIFGRFGFSDVLTVFLSMDTEVELYQGGVLPLTDFIRQKRDRDILTRLIVYKKPGRFVYRSMRAASTDFPVLTCAVSRWDGVFRAAIGARPMAAVRVEDETGILPEAVTEEAAAAFGEYVAARVKTAGNLRGSAAYRTHLVKVLTTRAALALGGMHDET